VAEADRPFLGGLGFSKSERLRRRREFLEIYEKGDEVHGYCLVLYLSENSLGHHRLGITASRKIGGAVVRNRVKRLLREVFRCSKAAFLPHCDLVVNAKRKAAYASYKDLQEDFLRAVGRWAQDRER